MNSLIAANLSCLRQGMELLQEVCPAMYARQCPEVFGSSIGGHYRHNIDHYLAFREGFPSGRIDYDARQRALAVETDPAAAMEAMQMLEQWFREHAGEDLDQSLKIRMDDGGDSTWSRTSLRRELQFLLSHTIHHYALVVSIGTRFGLDQFPHGFGIAPSTLHYQKAKGA